MSSMTIDVTLPKPHTMQDEILRKPAKRHVICAGRRGGKTTLLASYSVDNFLKGKRIVYGAPINKQTKRYWSLIKKYLNPLIQSGHIYKNETERLIKWAHHADDEGPMISAQTAWDADTWRGDWGEILIYDEYAYMKPAVWDEVGVPMLLDNDGEAWFISTPNRKNHFHAAYVRGLDPGDSRWVAHHFTSYDNPHLSGEALDEIVLDMTESMIKQEILAEFLDNEGAVFRNIAACHIAPVCEPSDHAGHFIVSGVDWAKKQDYTVISIGCRDCRQEISLTRFNKIDYIFQRRLLVDAWQKWEVGHGLLELNSIGEPNFELLEREGLPVEGFTTTGTTKPPLIENLVLELERETMQFLDEPIARAEMEAYEMKMSITGRPTYSAPPGVHDDTVIARALMVKAITGHRPMLI